LFWIRDKDFSFGIGITATQNFGDQGSESNINLGSGVKYLVNKTRLRVKKFIISFFYTKIIYATKLTNPYNKSAVTINRFEKIVLLVIVSMEISKSNLLIFNWSSFKQFFLQNRLNSPVVSLQRKLLNISFSCIINLRIEFVVKSEITQANFPSKTLFSEHKLQDSYAAST